MSPDERATLSRRINLAVGALAILAAAGALTWWLIPRTPQTGVYDADWTQVPFMDEVQAAYPPAARAAGLTQEVDVEMQCRVTRTGRLTKCIVLTESLKGMGFGQAALSLTDRFALRPVTKNGERLVGLPVNIPMRFPLPEPAETPPEPTPP